MMTCAFHIEDTRTCCPEPGRCQSHHVKLIGEAKSREERARAAIRRDTWIAFIGAVLIASTFIGGALAYQEQQIKTQIAERV